MKFYLIHSASESCWKLQNWLGFSSRIYESGLNLRFKKDSARVALVWNFKRSVLYISFNTHQTSCQRLLDLCPALPKYWTTHFRSSFLQQCYGLNCVTTPLHLYVEVLTPTTSECDLVWR